MSFVLDVIADAMTPRTTESAADWIRSHFYSHTGEAFSEQQCPWVTAPQGPCWAYDSIQFRTLWLQWAARMFKTNFGLAMLQRSMDQRPEETMFATPDETNCKSVFSRLWKMIEHCPRLRDQAPLRIRQSKTQIKLRRSSCHGAWPRGKSRLADKSIRVGHGNEIDKWVTESTSTEGDPIARFRKRGAEYPDRKFVLESTPSIQGRSAIETGRQHSTNHRYHVPCPHCCKFQTIEFGNGERPGEIHFDKSSLMAARRTAHYVCLFCEGKIEDIHRPWMMNRGVWVPAGCHVDHDRAMDARSLPPDDMSWLTGTPMMWGTDYGSQLSVFYALFHGWGDIACDFLEKKKNPRTLHQWINEDKGDTWEPVRRKKQKWEDVGQRIITTVPKGVVPADHSVVTIGVDKQGEFYVYSVDSWGLQHASHTLDYGTCDSVDDLRKLLIKRWPQESGPGLMPSVMLIDSGYQPADVHKFIAACVRDRLPARACRGSNIKLNGFYEQKVTQQRSSNPGQMVVWVDSSSTQDWIDQRLQTMSAGDPGAMTVYADTLEGHQDWLQQMLNDGLSQSLDNQNNMRETWERIDTLIPNDARDCKRYSFVGFLIANRGRQIKAPTGNSKVTEQRQKKPHPNIIERPGGWLKGMRQ